MDHGYPETPQIPYVYQEFPRCLYCSDGATTVVNTEETKKALLVAGWSLEPLPPPVLEPLPEPVLESVPETRKDPPQAKDAEIAPRPRGNPNWLKRG